MANQHDANLRVWQCLARFPRSRWSCSDLMSFTQARLLADACERLGMETRIERWEMPTRNVA